MAWAQGQHVLAIAPTGRGKTEVIIKLIEQRKYVLFLGTKRRDETQARLTQLGFTTVSDPKQIEPQIHHRIVLRPRWPTTATASDLQRSHHETFRDGIMRAFRQENWTIVIDEARYICDFLGLTKEVTLVLTQGRSQGNSVVAGTQRPRFIPLEFYDQSDHFFIWRDNDDANMARVSQMLGQHRSALKTLEHADFHDVLYVNDRTQRAMLTNTRWE